MHIDKPIDFLIVGGGISGLWSANLLRKLGYSITLVDEEGGGGKQTLASQGIIHGGLKYHLNRIIKPNTRMLSNMPKRWRQSINGLDQIDLRDLQVNSNKYFVFASNSITNRIITYLSAASLEQKTTTLHPENYPTAFKDKSFNGMVAELDEFVVDVPSLVDILFKNVANNAYQYSLKSEDILLKQNSAEVTLNGQKITARYILLCAGTGNKLLLKKLGLDAPKMQIRPLQQVAVYNPSLPKMYAHCLSNITTTEPRLTITTHSTKYGNIWYLGGRLATKGANMSSDQLKKFALAELRACIPWINWGDAKLITSLHQRAEPLLKKIPVAGDAFVQKNGPILTCWPIKLSLAPRLGDKLLSLVNPPKYVESAKLDLPKLQLKTASWEDIWNIDN